MDEYLCQNWVDYDRQCGRLLNGILIVVCGEMDAIYHICDLCYGPILACVGEDDSCYHVPISEWMVTKVMES